MFNDASLIHASETDPVSQQEDQQLKQDFSESLRTQFATEISGAVHAPEVSQSTVTAEAKETVRGTATVNVHDAASAVGAAAYAKTLEIANQMGLSQADALEIAAIAEQQAKYTAVAEGGTLDSQRESFAQEAHLQAHLEDAINEIELSQQAIEEKQDQSQGQALVLEEKDSTRLATAIARATVLEQQNTEHYSLLSPRDSELLLAQALQEKEVIGAQATEDLFANSLSRTHSEQLNVERIFSSLQELSE